MSAHPEPGTTKAAKQQSEKGDLIAAKGLSRLYINLRLGSGPAGEEAAQLK